MNKSFILLTIMIVLSPALSVMGTTVQEQTQVVPQAYDSSVGVVAGETYYYNIDQLVLPPEANPPNVTLPDFAGNQVYVKVMYVNDDYEYAPGVDGYYIDYAVGLIFEEDETITVGDGLISTDYIIPAGSATPSVVLAGAPHWNGTYGTGPSLFFINNDYADHTTILQAIGFTITDTATTFSATFVNGTGQVTGTWRKSDGVCTHLMYDDVFFMSDFTGFTFEISLDSEEYNPLPVTNGDVISFDVDIADISLTGTGDLYNAINQTDFNMITSEADALVGETMMSVVVTDVRGCYYLADTYFRNFETGLLEKDTDPVVFNGFFGSINASADCAFNDVPGHGHGSGVSPAITPDWRIYEGYTILGDTILGVYMDELMDAINPPADEIIFHAIEGGLALKQKGGYYYFQEAANLQVEQNMTFGTIMPEVAYATGATYTLEQNGYLCYTETGIGAAIYIRVAIDIEVYDAGTSFDTGTLHAEVDFKLRNPKYNPPEIINNNILPGFTWFIAIPTILGLAAIGLIIRRRR